MFISTIWWYYIWKQKSPEEYSRPTIGYALTKKKRKWMFMPKQNKLALLRIAEFVERAMITVIGLGAVTKIKWQRSTTVIIVLTNGALCCITKWNERWRSSPFLWRTSFKIQWNIYFARNIPILIYSYGLLSDLLPLIIQVINIYFFSSLLKHGQ